MVRFISCCKATLFVEKHADAALSISDRNSIWLHLSYCPLCRRYADQSALLNRLARAAAKAPSRLRGELSPEARERIRQRLL